MLHCIRERTECKNYREISLSDVGKLYAGVLVERVHRVSEGLIDNDHWGVYIKSSF